MNERSTSFYAALVGLTVLIMVLFTGSTTYAAAGEIDYRPLGKKLRDYIDIQKGYYGIYIIDIKSGKDLGINEMDDFHAASTFKVPLALYIYQLVAEGELDPGEKLVMSSSHMEGGTGRLQFGPPGTAKSIDELVRYAIVYSDNVATNMLLELVGRKEVKNYMTSLGGIVVDYEKNITCPRDMAIYMRETVQFAGKNSWGEKLMHHLCNTVYTDRIPHPLPDVPVANKIGSWPITGTYNDVAYVKHPERPYIVSVLSRQTSGYDEAVKVIREISRRVYAFQSEPARSIELVLDGNKLALSEQPFVGGGITLVPLRAFADAVPEINLNWDESTGTINLSSRLGEVEKKVAFSRGDEVMIIRGHSYVPLRDLCRMLGLGLEWEPEHMHANIATDFYNPVDNWSIT